MAKEPLSAQGRQALKRHKRDKEERLRWQFYRTIPQKHWRTMSGRQARVINEQAERYGLQQDHLALAKHLTAEAKAEEFVAGKGVIVRWERLRRQNHYFDALYNACAAGHGCGVRLVDEVKAPPPPRRPEEYAAYGGPRSAWTAGRPDGVFDYRR
jgi:hypothetical protein